MNWKGIILAAGDATRMPNKHLLPIKQDLFAIESSIRLLTSSCINDIIIVIREDSLLPKILPQRFAGWPRFKYVVQGKDVKKSYFHAVWTAIMGSRLHDDSNASVCITCCDNIYPEDERVNKDALYQCSSDLLLCTRMFPIDIAKHLTTFDSTASWTRGIIDATNIAEYQLTHGYECFAGYAMAKNLKGFMKTVQHAIGYGAGTEAVLNALKALPLNVPAAGWFDIGTPETYAKYWNE